MTSFSIRMTANGMRIKRITTTIPKITAAIPNIPCNGYMVFLLSLLSTCLASPCLAWPSRATPGLARPRHENLEMTSFL